MDLLRDIWKNKSELQSKNDSDCGRCIWKHRITMNLIQTFETEETDQMVGKPSVFFDV